MRQFDYTEKSKRLLTPEIVRYLTTIHEYKGEQRLIAEHHADVLESLVEVAKIQSTESSNKIEGIYTSDERLKKIVLDKTMPKTRNEREIAGYRDVLNTIHENFPHIPIRDTFILQLHRDLYKFENASKTRFRSIDFIEINGIRAIKYRFSFFEKSFTFAIFYLYILSTLLFNMIRFRSPDKSFFEFVSRLF